MICWICSRAVRSSQERVQHVNNVSDIQLHLVTSKFQLRLSCLCITFGRHVCTWVRLQVIGRPGADIGSVELSEVLQVSLGFNLAQEVSLCFIGLNTVVLTAPLTCFVAFASSDTLCSTWTVVRSLHSQARLLWIQGNAHACSS